MHNLDLKRIIKIVISEGNNAPRMIRKISKSNLKPQQNGGIKNFTNRLHRFLCSLFQTVHTFIDSPGMSIPYTNCSGLRASMTMQ